MSTEFDDSRLPLSNSVDAAAAESQEEEENQSYDERVAERAAERVKKFREKYPELAKTPLSKSPGQKLRTEAVEEEYRTEHVEGAGEWETGHTVERLDRVEPVTWGEAVFEFLTTRQRYDDGTSARFKERDTSKTFTTLLNDCWTPEYGKEQAAKNSGAERQVMGGQYPDESESERAGEWQEGEWTGGVATAMLTLTGSSTPNGDRLPPVDHAEEVTGTWSQSGGVYDVIRNICEHDLGLKPDEWGYIRGDDVHGMGAHDEPGENACHVHEHPAIYLDVGATDLREQFETDFEVRAVLETKFYEAVERHVERCEVASPEAHTKEKAVEVRLDLENPSGYATEYLRLNDEEEMMERPVEFQAFATVEWARNRQRIARSQVFTEAAKTDFCKQDADSTHGERVRYDRSGHGDGEVVCAECGSGVGVEAETLAEHRLEQPGSTAVAADGGHEQIGVRVGESPDAAKARAKAERYLDRQLEEPTTTEVLGSMLIDPAHEDVVEEVLNGENSATEPEPVMGEGQGLESAYELEAIVNPDGSEEEATVAGGGANMVGLKLPKERLLRETRLRWVGERGRPYMRAVDGAEAFATYNPEAMARWLVDHGYRRPWHAELALSFGHERRETPAGFEEPVSEPPPRVQPGSK